jgi:hypothetical protein
MPAEEAQHHDLRGARIDGFETRQRRFDGQEILDRYSSGRGGLEQIVERNGPDSPAALVAFLMAPVIDEEPSHRLRAEREAVRASLRSIARSFCRRIHASCTSAVG